MGLQDVFSLSMAAMALLISLLSYAFQRRTTSRPLLVFSMSSTFQWTLSNVGNGPATHVLVGDGHRDGRFYVVRCYPLAAGATLTLNWLRWGNNLAVVYWDALGGISTTTCNYNRNTTQPGNTFPGWPEPRHQWLESLYGEGRDFTTIHFDSDLDGKSAAELDVMRNRPFARHGYKFQRADLDAYFRRQPWYRPKTRDKYKIQRQFSAAEKWEIHTIGNYQRRNRLHTTPPVQELFDAGTSFEAPSAPRDVLDE